MVVKVVASRGDGSALGLSKTAIPAPERGSASAARELQIKISGIGVHG
jgi:hypothetical protein